LPGAVLEPLRDASARLPRRVDLGPGEPLRAGLLRLRLERLDLLAGELARARHAQRAQDAAAVDRAAEDLELARLRLVGRVGDAQPVAEVGLVAAELEHRVAVRDAAERQGDPAARRL